MNASPRSPEPIHESLQEYGRGIAGGLLFSLPLLYTMEVWWTGFLSEPLTLLLCIAATFLLLLGYNRYSGLHPGAHLRDVVIDSIEEFGIGILLASLVLFLLGRIDLGMPRNEIIGKVLLEAMLVSVGVSVGTAQLGFDPEHPDEQDDADEDDAQQDAPQRPHIAKQVILSFCGAVLFAANIAPTEEIVIVAIESPVWKLIALALLSLAVGALVMQFSGFYQAGKMYPRTGWLWNTGEVVFSYATALLAAAMLLWFFRRFNDVSLAVGIAEVVVLGFAAMLGASAGRLLIE